MKIRYLILSVLFLFFSGFTSNAQEKKNSYKVLTGKVIDSKFNPLKGISIYVDSVKTNIKTNRKGYFKIKPKTKIQYISAYSEKHGLITVDYSGEKEVNFVFSANSKKVRENELESLGFKDPLNRNRNKLNFEGQDGMNNFTNIYQLLKGRVPGVSVIGESISIRGANTASRDRGISTEPLFLVNGTTVLSSSVKYINPLDVKSIEVIKGPETAFYGSRGVYGVIKITLRDN